MELTKSVLLNRSKENEPRISVANLIKHFTIVNYDSRVQILAIFSHYNYGVTILDRIAFIRLATD